MRDRRLALPGGHGNQHALRRDALPVTRSWCLGTCEAALPKAFAVASSRIAGAKRPAAETPFQWGEEPRTPSSTNALSTQIRSDVRHPADGSESFASRRDERIDLVSG